MNSHTQTEAVVLDPATVELHRMAAVAARSRMSVLITGETGSGKEILAERIHVHSGAGGKLLRLNCAALARGVLESELFGHEQGAFTGAVRATPGLLEVADGGTVFLDEIGEMPLEVQARLLRVVEDGVVTRVGGRQPRQVLLRFVSATNRDLEEEVARGSFRRDLYYRLAGMVLSVPPLRERPAEIEPLARLFLQQAARAVGRAAPPPLSAAAVERLRHHPWPGNVRELRNVMGRALLVSGGGVIEPDHLPTIAIRRSLRSPLAPEELRRIAGGGGRPAPPAPLARAVPAGDERARIGRALEVCAGNQTRAAQLLGVSRATLVRRLSSYGFQRPRLRTSEP
jgi:two-component system, NtrC family, response regulator AtoC